MLPTIPILAYLACVYVIGSNLWPMPYRRTGADWVLWATLTLFAPVTLFTLGLLWVITMVFKALADPDPVPR